jgi:guanylate kinase
MNKKLIVFSGPSGSGKTTLVNRLLFDDFLDAEFSVSATSREPRKNEKDGKEYYFLTAENFKQKISENAFVEWEEVYPGRFYGTLKSEVERIRRSGKHVLFDIDAVGGINIKKMYGADALTFFVKPPSKKELIKRLKGRATEDTESLKMRIDKAEYELSLAEKFDYNVVNDDLEKAVNELKAILKAKCS